MEQDHEQDQDQDEDQEAGSQPVGPGDFRDQYLRAVAELDNTRKRAAREVEQAHRYALERFAGELLAVRDSLELGLAMEADEGAEGPLREGMALTLRQLDQLLSRHGVEIIDPAGQPFDPQWQEAVTVGQDPGVAPDTVLQVLQKGAALNGRLLRPARVIVSGA